jgi:iron complex outermembrane recepter protein
MVKRQLHVQIVSSGLDLMSASGRPVPGRRSLVSATCSLLILAAGAHQALAQQQSASTSSSGSTPSEEQLETVTVTGVRAAIENAINVKQSSDMIVEAVSAEDIGKLPDTSIAESISRLPGLTSQRSDGRASDISIRGTEPQFATGLLNGREQVSTGDNRSIEYDQYPSELISGVVVYKTPEASLIGQGLSGTIALQTIRPLEFGHRAAVIDIRGEKNSDANLGSDSRNNGYRASLSYIDQFLDDTLGVSIGYARLSTPVVGKEFGTYDPWHQNGTDHAGVPADVYVTDGIKSLASSGHNVRDGVIATAEWRPTGEFTSTLDGYFTSALQTNNRRSMEVNINNYNGYPSSSCPTCSGTANYSNLDVVNGNLVGATISNVVPLARNFLYITNDQIYQGGWNNLWKGDQWTLMSDVAYSRATRDEHDYETQAQYINGVTDTVTYYLPNGSQPTLTMQNSYTNPSQVLVGPTIYGGGYSRFPHVVDQLKAFRVQATRLLDGWFSDVMVGANYDDRTKDKRQPEASLSTLGNNFYQIPSNLLLSPANLSFSGTPDSLAWNVPGVLANYFQPINPSSSGGFLVAKNWEVFEKISTLFLKGDLNHPLSSDVTLRGNIGLQLVHTQQSSSSEFFNEVTQEPSPVSAGKSFNDVLPAANLVFMLPDEQLLRFSAARETARPRMDQMNAGHDFSIAQSTGIPYDTVGNPKLDPWRATALDLSYEKYFENKAYASVALFYKKLQTYIYSQTVSVDLASEVIGLPQPGAGQHPYVNNGYVTIPLNGQGGRLDGAELTLSAPGDMLTDWLTGFGASVSVSETQSSIRIQGQVAGLATSSNITLPGLSKTVASAMLYYERYGFAARIATRYRSDYIGEIDDYAGDRALEYVRHELITDFQTSYELQSGPAKGLMFLFQVNNLTNTPFIDYSADQARVRDYETFGRDMFFGVNYKF